MKIYIHRCGTQWKVSRFGYPDKFCKTLNSAENLASEFVRWHGPRAEIIDLTEEVNNES